jgi:hypothetical protein
MSGKPTKEAVTLEYDHIVPAPRDADSILRLSLKRDGQPVPSARILLRDVYAGTRAEVITEKDGNVFVPIFATSDRMVLLASCAEPFVETNVRLFFCAQDISPNSQKRTGKEGPLTKKLPAKSNIFKDVEEPYEHSEDARAEERHTKEKNEALEGRYLDLLRSYEVDGYMLDDTFMKNYVRKYGAELLRRHDEIRTGYKQFHNDLEFLAYLGDRDPRTADKLIAFQDWKVEALKMAMRLEMEPKPKPSTHQFRQRLVARLRVKHEDMKARATEAFTQLRDALQLRQQARAELLNYDLDEDERVQYELQIDDILGREEEEDNENFKSY